ncbi:hypothetical protein [Lysobacter changpingensis]|jgi:hypothetical protein|uniref:hypothetical protein n=1 Tax=Lysobacter changpingensis TaxID=2792784 RepID=UPI001F5C5567|nr:hypothetical protein [Lysobacter changpingensis]
MIAVGKQKSSDRIHRIVSRMHTVARSCDIAPFVCPVSMKMPSFRPLPLALLAALLALAGAVSAQDRGGPHRGDRGDRGHGRASDRQALSDSVRRVERRTGGQVLSAERVPYDGRDVNRVKVVDSSGRVRIYMDDPQSRDRQQQENRTRRDDD